MDTARVSLCCTCILAIIALIPINQSRGSSLGPLATEGLLLTPWRKLIETEGFRPDNLTAVEILEELKFEKHFEIRVVVNKREIKVYRNDIMAYEKIGVFKNNIVSHAGMHVVVLHPTGGHVKLARQFLTHQPAEDRNLAACLKSLMPGNILVVAAVPDAVMFLGPDAVALLEEMGASRIRHLARHETWVMVAHTPTRPYTPPRFYPIRKSNVTQPAAPLGRVWGESLSVRRLLVKNGTASSVDMTTYVPKFEATKCAWHRHAAMKEQRQFCDTYEGYIRLCKCHDPVTPSLRHSAPKIEMREVIPVAMLTAIKPFNFYRQLLNLLETPGAAETPILVLIDGPQKETRRLARLFGLDVLIHRPQGEKGTSTLLNMHIRFSVHNVFNFFPEADKAIILEDDLLLAPDFLSFFQQTSWLLDADPSISLVNAYSQLSYPNIASDPTAVRRSEIYPQYGWMLRRDGAKEMLQRWIPESELKDWDWWLALPSQRQWKDTIVPEVSRTFHAGAAGAHVDGYLQEHVYNSILLNEDPHVRLKNLEDLTLDRYMTMTQRDIERAVAVNLTRSPCEGPILPPSHPGPFKIYVESDTKDDNYYGFSVLQRCLQGNTHESLDTYRGMMKFNIKGRLLYIVGCPLSPFCSSSGEVQLIRPSRSLINSIGETMVQWNRKTYPPYFLRRIYPITAESEFRMENLLYSYFNGSRIYDTSVARID